jgi:L-iditol 2-dehydrogenase
MMRAQVFHGPGDLRFEELPVPEPGAGEVLLRTETALTCGTDVKTLRRGHPVMIPKVPTPFGHELCGTVVAAAPGVETVRVGDRVVAANSAPCGTCVCCARGQETLCDDLLFVNGAYADFILLPARVAARNLVRVPAGVPGERLAFAEPVACCLHALDLLPIEAGDVVAVFGHGPLGLMLGMLARRAGARVILVGKAGARFAVASRLGFEACVDVSRTADPVGLVQATGPVRHAIDATGRPDVWEQAIGAVDKGGTVIFFGGCSPGTRIQVDTRRLHYEELRLLGAFHHTPALIRRAVELLVTEEIDPTPLITHRMTLADVPEALEMMRRGEALKIAIRP